MKEVEPKIPELPQSSKSIEIDPSGAPIEGEGDIRKWNGFDKIEEKYYGE